MPQGREAPDAGSGATGNFTPLALARDFQVLRQTLAARILKLVGFLVRHRLQGFDQILAADQKRPAGLVTPEAMQQADGDTSADAEQFFDACAIDDRSGKVRKLL